MFVILERAPAYAGSAEPGQIAGEFSVHGALKECTELATELEDAKEARDANEPKEVLT